MHSPRPKVSGYVIEELIGFGGSGQVWRAHVRATGDPVAIKVLRPPAEGTADDAAAVRSEAAMLSALDHPHLVHLHQVLPGPDGLALVLDLAAGGSLADLLTVRGRLTVGEVITAIAPVGAALAHAHAAGVVHGDVSAGNVLFTGIGLPLLADLGVARLIGEERPARSTPAYLDPAVARGRVPTRATDVFMLGAVALHALTGAPLWRASTAQDTVELAARGIRVDLAARLADAGVPDEVAGVVLAALGADADRRPTAAEFALDLRHSAEPVAVELDAGRARRIMAGAAQPEPPLTYGVRVPPPTLPSRRPSGRRLLIGMALSAALGLIVGAVAAWWPRSPSQPAAATADRSGLASTVLTPGRASPRRPAEASTPPRPSDRPNGTALSRPSRARAAPTDIAGAARLLAVLDALRERAFAARDPALLARVYADAALRRQDEAQLQAIVPPGCGLHGVRTDYRLVRVTARHGDRVTVRARATLHASTLTCGAVVSGRAAGRPAEAITLVLARSGAGYRIAAAIT